MAFLHVGRRDAERLRWDPERDSSGGGGGVGGVGGGSGGGGGGGGKRTGMGPPTPYESANGRVSALHAYKTNDEGEGVWMSAGLIEY